MTDAEIEAIARLYCRKLGLDPDAETYSYRGILISGGAEWWKLKVSEVREALAMSEAIAEVLATVTEGGV